MLFRVHTRALLPDSNLEGILNAIPMAPDNYVYTMCYTDTTGFGMPGHRFGEAITVDENSGINGSGFVHHDLS